MTEESLTIRLLPADLIAINADSKITGITKEVIARHFMRVGIESTLKQLCGDEIKAILETNARATAKQIDLNATGGDYAMNRKDFEAAIETGFQETKNASWRIKIKPEKEPGNEN